jgi:hypothetical protein
VTRSQQQSETKDPNLAEIAEWHLHTETGVMTLTANLGTALILILMIGRDVGTEFTVAAWVLVAGAMLAVTLESCSRRLPKSRHGNNIELQSSIPTASRSA